MKSLRLEFGLLTASAQRCVKVAMSDSSGDPCEPASRESPHLDGVSQDDQGKAHDMKSMDLNVEQEGNQEVLFSELPETGPKEEQQETTDGVTYRHTPQTSPPPQHEPNEAYDTVKDATSSENVQYSAAKDVDSESIDINQIVQEEDGTTSVVASETVESYDTVKDTTSTENVQYSVEKEVGNEGIEMNQNVQEEGDSSSVVDSEAVQEAIEQNAEFVLPRGTEQSEAEYPLPRSPEVPDQKEHLELKVKIGESPGVEDVEAEQETVEEKAIDSLTVRNNESIEGGESLVYTATPRTLFEEESITSSDKPLNLSWSFGMNKNIPVFNLHDEDHQVIVYACAQTAVIHDLLLNRQRHLQAHCTSISCMCVSGDRRWIATADRGPESLIIIWDSFSGIPVHTIFHSHPEGGVIAITMSQNAKYLATVGGGTIQTVSIWDWTSGAVEPICTAELDEEFGTQNYITFNPQDHTQLITNSETQVIFYSWNESGLDYVTPPLNDKTFNKLVGNFSQSVFDFGSVRALTGTSAGKLAIWETIIPKSTKEISTVTPHNKKALKLMHVQKDGITVLTIHDRYFVTGDVRGHVKFYDQRLQLVNWYSDFNLAPIRSISFSKCNPVPASSQTRYPQDCSIKGNQFSISNFIVSTSDALVLHVFTDGTMLKKVLQEPNEPVHALACHPCKPYVAIGSYNGLLKIWNYEDKNFISRIFGKGKHVNCLAYNPSGFHMAAGFTDGSVHILDSVTLEDVIQDPFKYARGSITHINYSHNSQYLATADEEFTVTLFKVTSPKDWTAWEYVGRYRSHYKPIKSLVFAIELDSYEPRLLSLGMDRMLVEYDLKNSKKDNLLVSSTDRIEQSAVPQYLVWYPPVTKESFMLITNDQYKMKLFNATTKMCRKTLLGPTFGSPVRKMEVLSSHNHGTDKGFLAYITDDKFTCFPKTVRSDAMISLPAFQKQEPDDDSDTDEPNLLLKKPDSAEPQIIHSGHFMVSSPHSEHPPKKGYDFDTVNEQACQTYSFGKTSTCHLSIDASLTKLLECMTLAYSVHGIALLCLIKTRSPGLLGKTDQYALSEPDDDSDTDEPNLLLKKPDSAEPQIIHSGHFMVSSPHSEHPPKKGYDFDTVNEQACQTYSFGKTSTCHLSIDASLTKLLECMTLAYSGKLVSPKWKNFKGLKLQWRDKIRLNNAIWRAWYMQYIEKRQNPVCHFVTPLDASIDFDEHRRPEAIATEGKYWKRRIEIVVREYHKWRTYFKKRLQKHKDEDLSILVKDDDVVPWYNSVDGRDTPVPMEEETLLDMEMLMAEISDTLFSTISSHQHNPKEIEYAGNADMIQPDLFPLHPNLDLMDTFESFQDIFSSNRLPSSTFYPSASAAPTVPMSDTGLRSCSQALQPSVVSSNTHTPVNLDEELIPSPGAPSIVSHVPEVKRERAASLGSIPRTHRPVKFNSETSVSSQHGLVPVFPPSVTLFQNQPASPTVPPNTCLAPQPSIVHQDTDKFKLCSNSVITHTASATQTHNPSSTTFSQNQNLILTTQQQVPCNISLQPAGLTQQNAHQTHTYFALSNSGVKQKKQPQKIVPAPPHPETVSLLFAPDRQHTGSKNYATQCCYCTSWNCRNICSSRVP
ncbi:cilia- and flagella-associated 251 [Pelobates cultripes]|uniref:Cilia- and flagella-associated protein 251 n=1 Tax=Pelobates cultripes TaxID=61616 RepID=A0AAD1W6G0_PELCU|nr:cilia- and flagella-associated 251 [Pelobates cultripes]